MWFILIATLLLALGTIARDVFVHHMSLTEVKTTRFISAGLLTIIVLGFYFSRLETVIDENKIAFRWFPVMINHKEISWADIQKVKLIKYSFVGFGWRLSPAYGTVYNAAGDKGLRIILNNDQQYLLGTNKVDELKEYLYSIDKIDAVSIK